MAGKKLVWRFATRGLSAASDRPVGFGDAGTKEGAILFISKD
jgi:hypothetical protein